MRDNVILINCDDMGYGDLGCYGSTTNDTPYIDYLAEHGIRFTDFYAASSLCSPSRGALMTGCYPPRIGFGEFDGKGVLMPGQGIGLNPSEYTMAQMFKDHGYTTKMVGKWHCGDQPEFLPDKFGFDDYFGLPYSNDMGRQASPAGKPIKEHPPLPLLHNGSVIQEQPDQTSLTERYTEQCTRFIHENREQPFFLYLAHMHVHLPLYAAEVFLKDSRNGDFGACMSSLDWSTGAIWYALKQEGLLDNTMIIFTSDNGSRNDHGASNGVLRGAKGSTWEGGQRVPCILYWNRLDAGIYEQVGSNLDLLPTIAGLLGWDQQFPNKIDGQDISAGILNQNKKDQNQELFFYYLRNTLEAVRKGDWKLHLNRNSEPVRLLYNLREDPSESQDCYLLNQKKAEELAQIAEQMKGCLGCEADGITGSENRVPGFVADPHPLTYYDPKHPYIIHMYDKDDRG